MKSPTKAIPSVLSDLVLRVIAAENAGMRPEYYYLLTRLRGGRTLSQVGAYDALRIAGLRLTMSGVSRLLATMERKGFITRKRNPRDDRVKLLSLTDLGQKTVAAFESSAAALLPTVVADRRRAASPRSVKVRMKCPACAGSLQVPNTSSRVRIVCPHCRQVFHFSVAAGHGVIDVERIEVRDHLDSIPDHIILDVAPSASADVLSKARRTQLSRYHPDLFQHLGPEFVALATRRSQRVNSAFEAMQRRR